ncbi:uncharacterized protein METZ01_LOCUS465685 [marine metagenome]|uniref:Uncharacterized protein n=1 Tax=marine metagenome TaxID=408172 RepID=A0A383AYX6_9ZZZZ
MHIVDVIDWISDCEDPNHLEDLRIVVEESIRQLPQNRRFGETLVDKGSQGKMNTSEKRIRSVWGVSPQEFYDDSKNGTL